MNLSRALNQVRKEHRRTEKKLGQLAEAVSVLERLTERRPKIHRQAKKRTQVRRKMSQAARKRISKAQKLRWKARRAVNKGKGKTLLVAKAA